MVSGNIVKMRMVWSCLLWLLSCVKFCCSETDPGDLKILMDFKNGLDNPELLKWPENGDDPCGPPAWPCVFCSHGRVTQIQVQNLGLKGPLPQNFNQLKKLYNIGLQRNQFRGNLPTFRGLSELEYAFLNFNEFDTIPSDFFEGLNSIRVLALDRNPLNKTDGWSIPIELENYNQLTNLSLDGCNLVGPIPDFLGNLASLNELILSSNRLSGEVPVTFGQSMMSILWLNDQEGGGLTGSIDVIANMSSLKQAWLHGNSFTGKIPESIGQLSLLKDLNLNGNQLVGMVPQSVADMELDNLDLSNNRLMGPMPEFKAGKFSCESNLFCQSKPGVPCSPEVNALLGFLDGVNYPYFIASQWSGNDPCEGQWLGLNCVKSKVSVISLPRHNLTGSISPSIASLDSLIQINLGGNKLTGSIPGNLTALKSLTLLDVSGNNLSPPLPEFPESVKLVVQGNPLLAAPPGNQTEQPPSSGSTATSPQSPPINPPSGGTKLPPRSAAQPTPGTGSKTSTSGTFQVLRQVKIVKIIIIAGVVALSALIIVLTAVSLHCCFKKRKKTAEAPSSLVVHPRDPSDPGIIKISVSNNTTGSFSTKTAASSTSNISNLTENSHLIESENLVISVQVLRKATKDFAAENQLGSGGFGTVYKGELEDGTKIAVKRMEAGIMSSKALDEFQAEIAVLSRVRHRHLVSLLGFSAEGQERLLVYEYMSQGALSRHLFHWKSLNLEPLSWKRRLSVALDVARGMEYLHSMARKTFIHRDLKSSNILLDDHFHAKVSDFGLVKHAPSGEKSVVTRLAGTFGYLAPEYAVMGKITTKSDVFSYGVVLIELLTGLTALDEERSEERRYLAEWFWRIKSDKEKLRAAIDPALDLNEDTLESCMTTAELAGHCTAREPSHRPDMGHVVNVLGPLVEKWKPILAESEDISGIDYSLPLSQMLKQWQNAENTQQSSSSIGDSRGSIPARPAGFADSFNSADAR